MLKINASSRLKADQVLAKEKSKADKDSIARLRGKIKDLRDTKPAGFTTKIETMQRQIKLINRKYEY